MPHTQTNPDVLTLGATAKARSLVATALERYSHDPTLTVQDRSLLKAMSANVQGWTHTTRLREFLKKVTR